MLRAAPLLLIALAGCTGTPTLATYTGSDTRQTMAIGSWDRSFRIHVPSRATPGPVAPLILAYHGLGQTAAQLEAQTGLDALADELGAIVVYPEAALGQWDVSGDFVEIFGIDDIAFARQLINRMSTDFVIDKQRIIAVGLSNGAVFAQRLACEVTDQISGFVAVSGTLSRPARDKCDPSEPVNAFYIIGTRDGQFPVDGNDVVLSVDSTMAYWSRTENCSGRGPRLTLPDTAHDNTLVYRSFLIDCQSGATVGLDSVVGSGHGWPGSPIAVNGISRNVSANAEIRRALLAGRARPR